MTTHEPGEPIDLGQIETICILWFGLIGDTLLRIPTLERLKRACPQARITVLVDKGRSPLLSHHPDIDEILEMASREGSSLISRCRRWRVTRHLRRRRFDLMVNFYGGGKSLHIVKDARAKYRLGFTSHKPPVRRWVDKHHVYTHQAAHAQNCLHWGQGFTHILTPLGIKPVERALSPNFFIRPSQRNAFAESHFSMLTDRSFVLLNVSAGDSKKIWATTHFAQLADWLYQTHHDHIVLISNPKRELLAREVYARMQTRQNATILPPLSFDDLARIMSFAKFIVTGDTGLMHLAFSIRCPALVVFTHTPPEYVIPDDTITEYCFKPDPNHVRDGIHWGLNDVSVEDAKIQADKLARRLDAAKAENPTASNSKIPAQPFG